MDRVNQIWNHPLYQNELNKLQLLETDREFCRHTPEHFLDVARLAYIRALEENAPISKELIYCTALLHDIGRARQYEDGTPHDEAGAAIAGQILNELDFLWKRWKRSLRQYVVTELRRIRQFLENCSILRTKAPETVFPVKQSRNVTGLLLKKI